VIKMKNIFRAWLPFAVVTTAFCALVYSSVQQAQRHDANDPQIQIAEDAAAALNRGQTVNDVVPKTQVEMSASLAPFVVIFGGDGKPIAASGLLNGQMPDYPKGALDSARASGENRVTWQPTSDVRVASVVVPYKDGFVMVGRNLREVETRENQTEIFAAVTWVLALIATLVVIALGELFLRGSTSAE
jgi:hypothetical protein